MQEPVYITRDEIMAALDVKPTAYMYAEVDRACRAGSRAVEGLLHRFLYPLTATKYFDWPVSQTRYAVAQRVDFDEWALISATAVVSGGLTIAPASYTLEPSQYGPPYEHLDLLRTSSAAFSGGPQRGVAITGLWGWTNDETTVGTLVGSITAVDTLATVTAPASVGAILRIGQERVHVVGSRWIDSAQTASALTNLNNSVSITVSNGALFTENEFILIDSERMQVVEIAGNVLTVRRAVMGTVLAAHSGGVAIYWRHQLQIERGALGTTAAIASNGAAVYRWAVPSLAAELAQAYAEDFFLQRNAGYARTVGSGEGERQASGRGVTLVEQRAKRAMGRGLRLRSV